jgi:hypothetical protein
MAKKQQSSEPQRSIRTTGTGRTVIRPGAAGYDTAASDAAATREAAAETTGTTGARAAKKSAPTATKQPEA